MPNPFYADRLVFPGDEQVFFFNVGQKELPLLSLKEQLETPARQRPETEEGQERAYRVISANLEKLLEMDRLRQDDKAGIYVYEIVHRNYRQTGIWALTATADYHNGKIKLHELTLADSARRISNYRENTGLEGSPVLLTYVPSVAINRIIAETCAKNKKSSIGNKKSIHRIWKIEEPDALEQLITAFSKIESVYMADGHHRLGAAAKKPGTFISSLYIAADQLRIQEYYRLVLPGPEFDHTALLQKLSKIFRVSPSEANRPVKPEQPNVIGLCVDGRWFELIASQLNELAVVLLQEHVFAPLFGIDDPRADTRLKCIGGETALEETKRQLSLDPSAIAFTLYPMTVQQLIDMADAGKILPPKSTWIDPKVPYGLLLFQH